MADKTRGTDLWYVVNRRRLTELGLVVKIASILILLCSLILIVYFNISPDALTSFASDQDACISTTSVFTYLELPSGFVVVCIVTYFSSTLTKVQDNFFIKKELYQIGTVLIVTATAIFRPNLHMCGMFFAKPIRDTTIIENLQ